jgi:uncharacterized membrane protein YcaP (DUF421 family)
MNKYDIHLKDIERILLGDAPLIFLIEVFFRALIIYTLLLLIVRWLGKRMTGELTIMEMAVMLTLGAIASTPMQVPNRGILQGLVLFLCAVGFQRGISYLGYRSHKFEDLTQGTPTLMIKDGILQIDTMRNDRISRSQLLAALRQQQIFNLGVVERVYLEACGNFSVYKTTQQKPGLPVFPTGDDVLSEQGRLKLSAVTGLKACKNCGRVTNVNTTAACDNCKQTDFITAVE